MAAQRQKAGENALDNRNTGKYSVNYRPAGDVLPVGKGAKMKDVIIQGDCLEAMATLPDGCVDMVMTDPPYGTTACKWDSIIPLEPMWEHLKRIIKPNGAIVMTASQPFTTTLIASNMKMFKYCWVWEKERPSNIFLMKKQPGRCHEDIIIFGGSKYFPIMEPSVTGNKRKRSGHNCVEVVGGTMAKYSEDWDGALRYPRSVLKITRDTGKKHPTQKPVALMEYLIKTYTNEGELVLDFTCGAGTTGVACVRTGRHYIMIERDTKYVEIARNRVQKAKEELGLFGR